MPPVDIILANINKNVILANAVQLKSGLKDEGLLLLSGLLRQDEADILQAFLSDHFHHINTIERNGWISLLIKYIPNKITK